MSKPLPLDDFRAVRIVLEREDFAYAPEPDRPPSDLVDQETWEGIQTLPGDVAIRTSNDYGRLLRMMDAIWDAWIDWLTFRHDLIEEAILDVADEVRAATFNALHGYYRQAFGCLRNVLEIMTVATACELVPRVGLGCALF